MAHLGWQVWHTASARIGEQMPDVPLERLSEPVDSDHLRSELMTDMTTNDTIAAQLAGFACAGSDRWLKRFAFNLTHSFSRNARTIPALRAFRLCLMSQVKGETL